ncbi:phytoene desaturase family protein [Thermospira aquatica]|uniref:Phytoene desaturase n=1 Tax=Thermospira aquatica TaxID=2828656 RepID=A0AAX3BF74_9SPIR|nr:phytoene desaturase family protein [Thermospira aquatica]URA10871.1 phytoene desaturase [Thermospira aquatica]
MKKVAVIGAGMGGLAVAARLARMGWQVDVFEKRSGPGGKNFEQTWDGFRMDAGPSLLTMVEVFEELFHFCGKRFSDYCTPVKLDPICHYWFDDGSRTFAPGSVEKFIEHFFHLGWAPKENIQRFFRRAKKLYGIGGNLFLYKSLQEMDTYLSFSGMKSLVQLWRMDVFRAMHEAHLRSFDDGRMVQLFDRYATYNGSNPFQAPATLDIIPYVEYSGGGWAVREGIHALATALERLGKELGVRFFYNTPVERIWAEGKMVKGIFKEGKKISYDLVVSNADVYQTYRMLGCSDGRWIKRYRKLEPSSSGFVFYWGVDQSFPELGVHNIFFSADYRKEFEDIFVRKVLPEDPTVYINITSKVNPEDAPAGCENWFILINTPPHRGQNWEEMKDALRERILLRLEKSLGKSVRSHIVLEKTLTPADIERETGSTFGSIYGISSNSWNAAFLRHPNRSSEYQRLYLVGGSVHPGGGMPLVLLSAKIASELIEKYEKG